MTKIYTAMGNAKDGGIYFYLFEDRDEAVSFTKGISMQKFPKHDAFDIKWNIMEQNLSVSAEEAFNDMTEWVNQIHLRTN
jgi:hypothetical protein